MSPLHSISIKLDKKKKTNTSQSLCFAFVLYLHDAIHALMHWFNMTSIAEIRNYGSIVQRDR
jgi:hypothetical protein